MTSKIQNLFKISFSLLIFVNLSFSKNVEIFIEPELSISILTSANSWVYENPKENRTIITKNGIQNWSNENHKIRTYFRVGKTGKINIGFKAKVSSGTSIIKVTLNGKSKDLKISNTNFETVFAGTFSIDNPGYHYVEIQGVKRDSAEFAQITDLVIGGEATTGENYYIKEDVYWGRRGPSVHLNYKMPEAASDVLFFYNEMTIPKGEDTINTYFMANGFGQGYFGIQVNSETERRILFSVWSPFKTDDPNSIPDDEKIVLLAKGKNVIAGEFGNEGSGGQSRRIFNWKAGVSYKFLLKAKPSKNNSTNFTAYFFTPEVGKWELIASFKRPKTNSYVTRPHSFLENFNPDMGAVSRKVNYNNQWVYDTNGNWHEITEARFTADATAGKDSRLDYKGGIENGVFFLENCGFINNRTIMDTTYSRIKTGKKPNINFDLLPVE